MGDPVPDVSLSRMINYKSTSARLSDFKGDLLILDFWASWCTSCIKHFPKMEALQQQYGGRLQVLLVNSQKSGDDEQKIKTFFKKRKRPDGNPFTLPSVILDTALSELFPYNMIPHYVWISAEGRVIAITGAEEATPGNIQAALEGRTLNLPVKRDRTEYNKHKPLLAEGNGGEAGKLLRSGTLTRYLPGLPHGSFSATRQEGLQKFTYLNYSIPDLYQSALSFPANRFVLEVSDTSLFAQVNDKNKSDTARLYCYEQVLPDGTDAKERVALMVQDLNRYFNLNGRTEKRLVDCWVLVQAEGRKPRWKTKGGQPLKQMATPHQPITRLRNQPLIHLVRALNHQRPGWPVKPIVLDETCITTNVDLELKTSLEDLPALREELQAWGLDLVPAKRELELFVLTGNQRNN